MLRGKQARKKNVNLNKIIIIRKARKCRKFPSVAMLNEQSKRKQTDNMIQLFLLESERKFGGCCSRASRCSPRGP